MKEMSLGDLVNLLWSAQEIQKGSEYFFAKLEEEITSRIKNIKEQEFITLIQCFSETESKFS